MMTMMMMTMMMMILGVGEEVETATAGPDGQTTGGLVLGDNVSMMMTTIEM